jgi:hypothetical protein
MAAAERGEPGPDHYQLLGVARGASREEIAPPRLRAGPARVETPRSASPGDSAEEDIRLAVAELALRYLTRGPQGRGRPW